MNQGASGVKEYIQGKESKHCFVHVEKGSYFSGAGMAQFSIDYSEFPVLKFMRITRLETWCPTGLCFRTPVVLCLSCSLDESIANFLPALTSTLMIYNYILIQEQFYVKYKR